jgi:hypothetical protein
MRGVSAAVTEANRGIGSIEGGQGQTLQRLVLGAADPTLHSKLRERRERTRGCAAPKVRKEV